MSQSPLAVLLAGLPGAGKTALARALAGALDCARIDRDAERARLFPRARGSSREKREANRVVLAALHDALIAGRCCVVDGMTFASGSQRLEFRRAIGAAGGRCRFVFLDCPPAVAARRIAGDGSAHPAVDRSPDLPYEVARRFCPPDDDWLWVDGTQSPAAVAEYVKRVAERDWV